MSESVTETRDSELEQANQRAEEMISSLDHPGANQLLEEILRTPFPPGPELNQARLLLGETSLVIGRWERAQRELERLAEAKPNPEILIRCRLGLGELYSMRGEPDQARQHLSQALQCAEQSNLERWIVLCQVRLGALAGQTGELDTAKNLLEKAEKVCSQKREQRDWVEIGAALDTQWGLYHFRLSQNRAAEEKLEGALEALRNHHLCSLEEPHILRYLGVMASLKRENKRSLQYHLEALDLYGHAGNRYGQAKVYDSIGRTLQGANRLDEAIFTFKKAESLCRRLGAHAELATLYGKLGQVAMLRDDMEGAIRYFQKDLELSNRYRNYYALGYSYRNLGRCLMQVGRYPEAVVNLRESLGLFQYVEDWLNLARVYMDLGFAHAKAGEIKEAAEVSQRADALFKEHNLHREAPFLRCLEGIVARSQGNFDEAERNFRECIDQLQGKSSGGWLAEAYYEMGILYREFKHVLKAVDAFKAAVRTARAAGLNRQVGRFLQELEDLDELELFRVWMEDLPAVGDSSEGPPSGEH